MRLPTHTHLDSLAIRYETVVFDAALEKGIPTVVRALADKVTPSQIVKSLIFQTSHGELVLALVASDRSVVSGKLKKAVDDRNVRMATPEQIAKASGYDIGAIPPFSWQPEGFRTLVDSALMSERLLAVGAGKWGEEILLTPSDLVRAASAQVVPLTDGR